MVTMTRIATVAVEGLLVVSGLIAAGSVAALTTQEERVTSSVEAASQPPDSHEQESTKSAVPSNIVTSKEPEPNSSTKNDPPKRMALHRNPDYDSSGNIVLDLGAKINDMAVVENNLVVVSPTAQRGKMFFVHIEPGAGLKGVKVTDTFGWAPESSDRLSRRMLRPCVVVYDRKRFGDPEDKAGGNDKQKPEEEGYLRVVLHCASGGTPTKEGTLNQTLNLVAPNPSSSEGLNSNMSNPIVRVPVSIDEKGGPLVAHTDRAQILSDVSPESSGLFKTKTVR